jgi:cell division septal protein FtsQ
VFVLVDEEDLLNRIMNVSARNPERQQFVNKVYTMLNREPFVSSSTLRYSWPNDVEIEITEINPVAIVNSSALLLGDCSIVETSAKRLPVRLLDINMGEGSIDTRKCDRIMEIVSFAREIPVNTVTVLENDDYVLGMDGHQLVTGYENIVDRPKKIQQVIGLIKAGKIDAEYIDMRYVAGIAVSKVATL